MITQKVQESQTLALLGKVRAMKAAGEDVVSFAAGEPDFDTPIQVIEAAEKSMRSGNTRYVASQGQPNVREEVSRDARDRLNAPWVQAEHVLVTGGAKQGLYLLLDSILEPGDEAMIPVPYWVSYPGITEVVGGKSNFVKTQEANGYFPTVAELDAAYNPKVKALVFSSPSNPTGCMIDAEQLREIGKWCIEKRVYLIYDELYERLVLNDSKSHVSLFSLFSKKESEYLFSVNACSKTLAMTGWRLGWI
ncbi:aminotransferase class I/II-fold pyridoxal phosphate-dependent enzyme, partial [bacterium]|nr:aminotransferase class I/II-fold pyridoxal phosphate-dependent enzyme [bacterium]